MSISLISSAWQNFYNNEDSLLPFLVPLAFWLGGFCYCNQRGGSKGRPSFHQWKLLHNIHNLGGMLLATLSVYFNNDSIFNERITILWSLGYFGVDLVDCFCRGDVAFTLHASICLVLAVAFNASPVFRKLRIGSKALFCELSSPFLHLARDTRDPLHFALFALVFCLCRVVWLPYFLSELRHHNFEWYDFRVHLILAFYGLNLYWFYNIIRILLDGVKGTKSKKTT